MFKRISIRLALTLGDLTIIAVSLALAVWLRPYLSLGQPLTPDLSWLAVMVYGLALLVWGVAFSLTGVYDLGKNLKFFDEAFRVAAAHFVATLAFAGTLYFSYRQTSRLQVLVFAGISLILMLLYRGLLRLVLLRFGSRRYGVRKVLVVGNGAAGREVVQTLASSKWTGLHLVGFVDDAAQGEGMGCEHLGTLAETVEVVQQQKINEVVFTLPRHAHTHLANLVVALHSMNVNVRVVPDFFDLIFLRSVVEDLGDIPMVTLKEPVLNPLQRLIKRTFDVVVGVGALILSLPIMLMVAIGIKLDSPGPILFSQERVGENGRIFKMYKFRSMVHTAGENGLPPSQRIINGKPAYKFYDDPRVTRFGRYLRQLSLDELPQLFNIIKGDMSLVGPRPELPWLVNQYQPWQNKRFEVPQGLTGWWQVNGRADKPMHLNTQDDIYYIKNYSLWLDIQILFRTVGAVIRRRGSY
ncbi:MAG: sugar transferase [Anaerolineae bacterium]